MGKVPPEIWVVLMGGFRGPRFGGWFPSETHGHVFSCNRCTAGPLGDCTGGVAETWVAHAVVDSAEKFGDSLQAPNRRWYIGTWSMWGPGGGGAWDVGQHRCDLDFGMWGWGFMNHNYSHRFEFPVNDQLQPQMDKHGLLSRGTLTGKGYGPHQGASLVRRAFTKSLPLPPPFASNPIFYCCACCAQSSRNPQRLDSRDGSSPLW